MLYKVSPFGYFGRVSKVSQGPWFKEHLVEEDGLEYYYLFNSNGKALYLLSSNIPLEDREKLQYFYYSLNRNHYLAWFGGLWLGAETVLKCNYFKKMAVGWRFASVVGLAFAYKTIFQSINS